MDIILTSLAFLVAALCAGTMGFAIQRGGTCTVAAVDEVVGKRRFNRLAALVEDLDLGRRRSCACHGVPSVADDAGGLLQRAISRVLGGILLGLRAYINRVVSPATIARSVPANGRTSPHQSGCCVRLSHRHVRIFAAGAREAALRLAGVVRSALACRAVRRLPIVACRPAAAHSRRRLSIGRSRPVCVTGLRPASSAPHSATTVIGITFFVMFLLVGAWDYTGALAELARGMSHSLVAKLLLLWALFLGAVLGGYRPDEFAAPASR